MKSILRLLSLLDKWKPYYLLAGFMLILSTFVRMLEPKVVQIAIDGIVRFFQNEENLEYAGDKIVTLLYALLPDISTSNFAQILLFLAGLYLIISFLQGLFMFSGSAISAYCSENATKKLRNRLFLHIQLLPMIYHRKTPTGELVQRCTGDIETIRQFMINQVVELIRFTAIFGAAFMMMAFVNITYAIISVALVPVIGFTSYLFFQREKKIWKIHEAEQDKLSTIAEENIAGTRVVKAFTAEKREAEKFDKQNLAKRAAGIRHLKLHANFWPISDLLVNFQITTSVIAGGYFIMNGHISVGELVSFYTYALMVTWPMRAVGRIVTRMGMATVAAERIFTILDSPVEKDTQIPAETEIIKGSIRFDNVTFSYEDSQEVALKNVSFTINPGEKVAIIGPTGAGKSSVVALLLRFFNPEKGSIFIDEKNIESYQLGFIRDRIGCVLQNPFLFSTSIKGNIAYTQTEESAMQKVIHAAGDASIHHIIEKFPEGYDTVVGEKGVTLSGGQKQRIALARTLAGNPDILILDDATSSVDTETEYHIQQALKNRLNNITTIIIAHRFTSLYNADRIIVLENGEVTAMGTHEELLQDEGYYKDMLRKQQIIEDHIKKESGS